MKFPDMSLFAADTQCCLDPHWGFWISHVVSQTKSISTSSSLLGLGLVKYWSWLVMPMPLSYDMRDSVMLVGKQIRYAFLLIIALSSQLRGVYLGGVQGLEQTSCQRYLTTLPTCICILCYHCHHCYLRCTQFRILLPLSPPLH